MGKREEGGGLAGVVISMGVLVVEMARIYRIDTLINNNHNNQNKQYTAAAPPSITTTSTTITTTTTTISPFPHVVTVCASGEWLMASYMVPSLFSPHSNTFCRGVRRTEEEVEEGRGVNNGWVVTSTIINNNTTTTITISPTFSGCHCIPHTGYDLASTVDMNTTPCLSLLVLNTVKKSDRVVVVVK